MVENNQELPKGWAWSKIGDICLDSQYGWTTSAEKNGNLHLLRTTDITSGSIDWENVPYCKDRPPDIQKYLVKDNDILISRAGSVGFSHLIKNPQPAVFASYLIRFRTLINEKYFAYFLKSPFYWNSISEKSLGIAVPNVNATKIKEIPIPIPPTNEQKHIVSKIEELFNESRISRQALDKIPPILKKFRQSVLDRAFRGELVTQDSNDEPVEKLLQQIREERRKKWKQELKSKGKDPKKFEYEESKPVETEGLPELPEGWGWATLEQIASVQRGKFSHRPRNSPQFYNGKYPFIQTGDIANSKGRIVSFKQTLNEKGLGISKMFKKGTIMIAIAANIGDSAILGFDACATDSVVGIIPDNPISSEFVEFYLRTQKSHLENFAPATAQKNINLRILNPLPISIPPLNEQKRIVAKIEELFSFADQIEKSIKETKKRVDKIDQSILSKAFSGELVTQDSNDEPASVLLNTINTKREKNQKHYRQRS